MVLKSGANRVHGPAYEFTRRNGLDANSFQNNARGAPKDSHYLDQYGAQVDGPICIPKIYNGRNKTFFPFNYEGCREGTPQPPVLSVPETDMRAVDFSKLVDGAGRPIKICDPAITRSVSGVHRRDPSPANVVPAARVNPIARKIAGFSPEPNTRTPGVAYAR